MRCCGKCTSIPDSASGPQTCKHPGDNAVKVMDFGVALRLDSGDETGSPDAWSGPYASPEEILPGASLGFAMDSSAPASILFFVVAQ